MLIFNFSFIQIPKGENKSMLNLTDATWWLSHYMLKAAKKPLFTTALIGDEQGNVKEVQSGWAGPRQDAPSRAPYFGPMKAIELLHSVTYPDADLNAVVLGPVVEYPGSPGYRGGMRFPVELQDGSKEYHITTGSGDAEDVDLLIAHLMNWAMKYETRFHHVGFRHESQEAMLAAVVADRDRLGVMPSFLPEEDHDRYYLWVAEPELPNGGYWIEHQYFPDGRKDPGVHIDVATAFPHGLLTSLAYFLKVKEVFWQYDPAKDPIGKVGVTDRAGVEFAVMGRERWWQVPPHTHPLPCPGF